MSKIQSGIQSCDISIVLQGPVSSSRGENIFSTAENAQQIRKIFPESEIIISTWEDSDLSGIVADKFVLSKDPGGIPFEIGSKKTNNINRMLVSSQAGVRAASRPYILKLRSDLMPESTDFIGHWERLSVPPVEYGIFSRQILAYPVYSLLFEEKEKRMPKPFHISDWAFFGESRDILSLFNIELVKEPNFSEFFKKNKVDFYDTTPKVKWQYSPEQYLFYSVVKNNFQYVKFNHKGDYSEELIKLSEKFVFNNFVFIDDDMWKLLHGKGFYNKPIHEYDKNCFDGLIRYGIGVEKRIALGIPTPDLDVRGAKLKLQQQNASRADFLPFLSGDSDLFQEHVNKSGALTIIVQGGLFKKNIVQVANNCTHWRDLFENAQIICAISSSDFLEIFRTNSEYSYKIDTKDGLVRDAFAVLLQACDTLSFADAATPLPPIKNDSGICNANLQISTSKRALEVATGEYVLRIRNDMIFYDRNFLDQYVALAGKDRGRFREFRQRVLMSPLFTLNPFGAERMPFHYSDWFHFGLREDVTSIWQVPFMTLSDLLYYHFNDYAPHSNEFEKKFYTRIAVEQHIAFHRFKKKFSEISLDFHNDFRFSKESVEILFDNFVLCNLKEAKIFFEKYNPAINDRIFDHWCITQEDCNAILLDRSSIERILTESAKKIFPDAPERIKANSHTLEFYEHKNCDGTAVFSEKILDGDFFCKKVLPSYISNGTWKNKILKHLFGCSKISSYSNFYRLSEGQLRSNALVEQGKNSIVADYDNCCALYGPYVNLGKGTYRADFVFSEPLNEVVTLEISSLENAHVASKVVDAVADRVSIEWSSPVDLSNVEARFFVKSGFSHELLFLSIAKF
ncbi:WavE lipopolysaccharide synthesis family protein [Novosphingobium sediminicola]|uniref:WavE lipopolysaccharide synthesis n=1 Tax=Novosphingobium sediminicola TaxID=563162 RepID=A0A7W6G8D1_9SPHN|nr:WavE lipopolysaccharide synthesis family protein [Novosphingobium sediminicola]MBB3957879.1 hypothetical protein [Novosphingobium sediminicola]